MHCLNLMVFLLGDILRNIVAVNCPGLPFTTTDIQLALETLLEANSTGVKENVTAIITSGPFFTCQVQGTAIGTYQKVSLTVQYNSNQDRFENNNAVRQFEMECVEIESNRLYIWSSVANSLSTPGVDYTTISLWKNCSDCVSISPPNVNHCQRECKPL